MFYRVSTTVISPALAQDIGLTSSQLGDLSAAFYYAFALSQIPLGLALDRWGARRSMSILAVAGVSGALLFALGTNLTHLVLARILLGIGMSGNLMAVLALLAAWFPVNRFGFLSGVVVSVGVMGNLLAATPLALLSQALGWRGSFLSVGLVNAAVVLAFFLVTRDTPAGERLSQSSRKPLLAGLGRLVGMYSYWAISLANFVRYGFFAALQGLWVGPFLINGIGMEEIAAANAVLVMGLGYMISLPVSGFLSDRVVRSRKKVVLPALICFALLNLSILFWTPDIPYAVILVSFFGLGFFAAPGQIMYAHIKELIPFSIISQAMTSVNLFTVLGAAILTQVLGMLVAAEPSGMSGTDGFRAIWYVGFLTLALVSFLYAWTPESSELTK